MRSLSVGGAALLLALASPVVVAAPYKPRAVPSYKPNQPRATAVKNAFQVSWDGYYQYAFPHDSLRPVTNGYADDRCANPCDLATVLLLLASNNAALQKWMGGKCYRRLEHRVGDEELERCTGNSAMDSDDRF